MQDMMAMNYEDFNTLLFMAYKQNSTEEGRKEQQAEELQDQMEDLVDGMQGYNDGYAIQKAIEEGRLKPRANEQGNPRNRSGRGVQV